VLLLGLGCVLLTATSYADGHPCSKSPGNFDQFMRACTPTVRHRLASAHQRCLPVEIGVGHLCTDLRGVGIEVAGTPAW
jgi:hypothetical protein